MKILITGIRGQMGQVLVKLLQQAGVDFVGLSREEGEVCGGRVYRWPDTKNILAELIVDECITGIIHLAGQSSVSKSYAYPKSTYLSNVDLASFVLSSLELLKDPPYLYVALSSEMYGQQDHLPITLESSINPQSPYGESKVIVKQMLDYYRAHLNIRIGGGITFNHESEFRDNRFFIKSLVNQSIKVRLGDEKKVVLGNLDIQRDFSDAFDIANAILRMVELSYNGNLIICSGKPISLRDLQEYVFFELGIENSALESSTNLFRPNEIFINYGDPTEAMSQLDWVPESSIYRVLDRLLMSAK